VLPASGRSEPTSMIMVTRNNADATALMRQSPIHDPQLSSHACLSPPLALKPASEGTNTVKLLRGSSSTVLQLV